MLEWLKRCGFNHQKWWLKRQEVCLKVSGILNDVALPTYQNKDYVAIPTTLGHKAIDSDRIVMFSGRHVSVIYGGFLSTVTQWGIHYY